MVSLYPHQAQWACGVPITGVQGFAGIEDRCRSYVVEGAPIVTGLVAVGDAWACTNPSLGRGASFGIAHARILRDVLRECAAGDNPEDAVQVFHEATRLQLLPLFDQTVTSARHRLAEMDANIDGAEYQTADVGWSMGNALHAAAFRDPDLLRAYVSIAAMIATPRAGDGHCGAGHAGHVTERERSAVFPTRAEPVRAAGGAHRGRAGPRLSAHWSRGTR